MPDNDWRVSKGILGSPAWTATNSRYFKKVLHALHIQNVSLASCANMYVMTYMRNDTPPSSCTPGISTVPPRDSSVMGKQYNLDAALSLAVKHPVPLCCMGEGQSVRDDLTWIKLNLLNEAQQTVPILLDWSLTTSNAKILLHEGTNIEVVCEA